MREEDDKQREREGETGSYFSQVNAKWSRVLREKTIELLTGHAKQLHFLSDFTMFVSKRKNKISLVK